jgi:hypothetical protein
VRWHRRKGLVSTLRFVGHDDMQNIEHEDSLMLVRKGLEKTASLLKEVVIAERVSVMW